MSQNKYGVDNDLLQEFVAGAREMLDDAANIFIVLESDPHNKEAIDTVFRAVHTIKGNSAFFNLLKVKSLSHIMEDLMNLVRDGKVTLSSQIISSFIKGTDALSSMMNNALSDKPEVKNEEEYNLLMEEIAKFVNKSKKEDRQGLWKNLKEELENFNEKFSSDDAALSDLLRRITQNVLALSPFLKDKSPEVPTKTRISGQLAEPEPINTDKAALKETSDTDKSTSKSVKTMRIAESDIDEFLDYVGELVTIGEMYNHIHKRLLEKTGMIKDIMDFQKNNDAFSTLSQNLQKSILQVRKVPVKNLVMRAPRMIRDIALPEGKEIKTIIKGDDLLIDKSLLESLDGPFTHMIRNAADHGIETPEIRKQRNKPREGTININISEDEENMFIIIQDDGSGINKEGILKKSISKGVISGDQALQLTDQEIYQLIFEPGLSLAEKVTDVSGRGVGMDVVKKNIDSIGGKVIIESKPEKGSKFSIQFPKTVTVKIIQGFLITVGEKIFILPMNSVGESFKVQHETITKIPGSGESILRHNIVYPLVRLNTLLKMKPESSNTKKGVGVTIMADTKTVILLVDEVLGSQQVVVKNIEGLPYESNMIMGGSILGDEKVAIVLNVDSF